MRGVLLKKNRHEKNFTHSISPFIIVFMFK